MKNMKFKMDDRVVFVNAVELTGKTGTIVGVASLYPEMANYIVLLDAPAKYDAATGLFVKAIVITEHCIEKE